MALILELANRKFIITDKICLSSSEKGRQYLWSNNFRKEKWMNKSYWNARNEKHDNRDGVTSLKVEHPIETIWTSSIWM